MGNKRLVDVDFWENTTVLETLSAEDRYFYLFLLTNPCVKQLGIYRISISKAMYYTGYNRDALNALFDRFENVYRMIRYNRDTDEVAIKNYLRHAIVKGGKPVMDCLLKDAANVKDKSLLSYIKREYLKASGETNATVLEFLDTLPNDNDDDIDNDNDNDSIVATNRPRIANESSKPQKFIPPTVEEVTEHVKSINGTIDPIKFVNYYESNGWMVGKHKMKNWKAAVNTWERNQRTYNTDDNTSREEPNEYQ